MVYNVLYLYKMLRGETMADIAKRAKLKSLIYKCSVYSLALFIIAIAHVTFFSKINVLNATPDLLLAAIVALCVKEEHKVASICAIVSGFLYCALGATEYPIYIIFSFLCVYVLKIFALRSFSARFSSFIALCAIAFGAKILFNIMYLSVFSGSFSLIRIITRIALPEFVSSLILCPVSYAVTNTIFKLINKKSKPQKENLINEQRI